MIKIAFAVDTSKIDRSMADFPAMVAEVQSRVLAYVGQTVASRATQAFRTPSFRPSPWAPRKPVYTVTVNKKTKKKTRKLDDHPLLIRSGALRQSVFWKFSGDDAVVVGSDRKYAAYHQHGTKRMPARPFVPVDAQGRLVPAVHDKISRGVARIVNDEMRRLKS